MTERATVFQNTQLAAETVAGTAVPATKMIQAWDLSPAVKTTINLFTPVGRKYATIASLGRESIEAKLDGIANYEDLQYLMAGNMVYAAPVQLGATAAYLWTSTPSQTEADARKTYTIEQGGKVRAQRWTYGTLRDFGYAIAGGNSPKFTVNGVMIGKALEDDQHMATNEVQVLADSGTVSGGHFHLTLGGQTTAAINYNASAATIQANLEALSTIGAGNVLCTGGPVPDDVTITFVHDLGQTHVADLTVDNTAITGGGTLTIAETTQGAAPTAIPVVPIEPTQVQISLDTTAAGLGGTLLTRVMNFEFSSNNRWGAIYPINSALNGGFAATLETKPALTAKIKMEADSAGMTVLTSYMRNGTKFFIRVKAIGANIVSTYYYTFQHDMCCLVSGDPTFADFEGLYTVEYPLTLSYDSTWTKTHEIQLTNTANAL